MTSATMTTPGGGLVLGGDRWAAAPAEPVTTVAGPQPWCEACGVRRRWAGHRLCWHCWQDVLVRARFPDPEAAASVAAQAREAVQRTKPRTVPARPTDAPPGSLAKIAVLEARAEAGELLYHPDDARDKAGAGGGSGGRLFLSDGPAADGGWDPLCLMTVPKDPDRAGEERPTRTQRAMGAVKARKRNGGKHDKVPPRARQVEWGKPWHRYAEPEDGETTRRERAAAAAAEAWLRERSAVAQARLAAVRAAGDTVREGVVA